jgi:uncharacterized lipoprotein NlpE involved in copper resistance
MKKITLTLCTIALLLFACNNEKKEDEKIKGGDTAPKKEQAWIPIDSIMMDKAWKEGMAIGEPHKMMAKASGTWTSGVTMWMADGAPPMTSTSTTVNSMIFGGLYQQSKHSGDMMGMPFEGMSIMGYDNMKKEYFSTWIDNMGSGIYVSTGQWDDASKKLTLSGSIKCMNGQDGIMRQVFTIIDDNNQMLEMYGPDPKTGKEYKNMEIKYTRKK